MDVQVFQGQELGKYVLLEQLGTGGFGQVWKADDRWLDLVVAIKIPYRQDLDIDTLCSEARAVAALSSTGVVPIRTVERVGGMLVLVFDFMPGGSLASRCRHGGMQDLRQVARYFRSVAAGLAAAHGQGIIHRDIKPENVLIDAAGEARLCDFGIAVPLGGDPAVAGTPAYMAPECWSREYSVATDMFSLGATLYECLSGRRPFDSAGGRNSLRKNIRQGRFARLDTRCTRPLPTNLVDLVHSCLAPEPCRRPSDVAAFLAGMQADDRRPVVIAPLPDTRTVVYLTEAGILDVGAEGVCYAANNNLAFGGGASGAVLQAAGPRLRQAAANLIRTRGPIPVGNCAMTDAYDLVHTGCRKLFHLATLAFDPVRRCYEPRGKDYLGDISRAVASACHLATDAGLSSLALPQLGTRVGGLSPEQAAAAVVRGVYAFVLNEASKQALQELHLCAFHSDPALHEFTKQLHLIRCQSGEILNADTEAVVVSANNWLVGGSGTAKAAAGLGGEELATAIRDLQRERCPLEIGTAVELPSGGIQDTQRGHRQQLYYAVSLGYRKFDGHCATGRIPATPESVYQAVVKTLRMASAQAVRSIAFPLMGARPGYSTVPERAAPRVMLRTMVSAINDIRPELTMERIAIYLPPRHMPLANEFVLRIAKR